jgi:hypothetical protein
LITVCQQVRSPYHLSRGTGQYHRLNIVLTGVIVARKDGKRLMSGDRHDALIVPSLPNFSGDECMAEVMKAQVRHSSLTPG